MNISSNYLRLFSPGTNPFNWKEEIPTYNEIIKRLKELSLQLKETLLGCMKEILVNNFKGFTTIEELINFTLFHEGIHLGTIRAIKRNLKH